MDISSTKLIYLKRNKLYCSYVQNIILLLFELNMSQSTKSTIGLLNCKNIRDEYNSSLSYRIDTLFNNALRIELIPKTQYVYIGRYMITRVCWFDKYLTPSGSVSSDMKRQFFLF